MLLTVVPAASLPLGRAQQQPQQRLYPHPRQPLYPHPQQPLHPHPQGLRLVLTEHVVEQLATHVKDRPMGYTCNLPFCMK